MFTSLFPGEIVLVPVLRLHHEVAHSHRLKFAVQVIAEGPSLTVDPALALRAALTGSLSRSARFVTGVNPASELLLFGHEVQEPIKVHLLHRLRGGPVKLPGHVIPLRVGIDIEFDRVVGFG